jgi:CxxC motif-containing protein (DUF1111 family)
MLQTYLSFFLLLLIMFACDDIQNRDDHLEQINLVADDTTNLYLLGKNAFMMPIANLSEHLEDDFYTGNSFFNQIWVSFGNSTQARDGLGPLFNHKSCSGCHPRDGRGDLDTIVMRASIGQNDQQLPLFDHIYGGQLQTFAITKELEEINMQIDYVPIEINYNDGSKKKLTRPKYQINWQLGEPIENQLISARIPPQMIGLGLLESIPETRLQRLADPEDLDQDGISGTISMVFDLGAWRIGRFGWKAEKSSVRSQVAQAFHEDIGITSSLHPFQNCGENHVECLAIEMGDVMEISDDLLNKVVLYSTMLAVPISRSMEKSQRVKGEELFKKLACSACHVPKHITQNNQYLELNHKEIWPYTDLLLHDMGEDLSDQRPIFKIKANEWRTPPLWGIGRLKEINGHMKLMHDGRANGIEEAILWHGGEANVAKEKFISLSKEDRMILIRFVESL